MSYFLFNRWNGRNVYRWSCTTKWRNWNPITEFLGTDSERTETLLSLKWAICTVRNHNFRAKYIRSRSLYICPKPFCLPPFKIFSNCTFGSRLKGSLRKGHWRSKLRKTLECYSCFDTFTLSHNFQCNVWFPDLGLCQLVWATIRNVVVSVFQEISRACTRTVRTRCVKFWNFLSYCRILPTLYTSVLDEIRNLWLLTL